MSVLPVSAVPDLNSEGNCNADGWAYNPIAATGGQTEQ